LICPKCTKDIPAGSQFCWQCGTPIHLSSQPESTLDFLTKSRSMTKRKRQRQILVSILLIIIVGCVIYGVTSGGFLETFSEVSRSSRPGDQEFTIRVTGDSGLKFRGDYMLVASGQSSASKSVEGTTPSTYTATGTMLSISFQKQCEGGALRVTILRGGTIVRESSTTAAFGVVTVTTN